MSEAFQLRLHKIRAQLFGSEIWILESKRKEKAGPQQKRYGRPTAGYTPTDYVTMEIAWEVGTANTAEHEIHRAQRSQCETGEG
jgi:hypothetical protein